MAPRVAACSGVSVRSGTFCACAWRGVSMTSAPPTENASAPMAAPFMKARRCMSSMIFPPATLPQASLPALWPPFGTDQNSTLKWLLNQAGSGVTPPHAASLRLLLFGVSFLRGSFLRVRCGVCHRRAARRPQWRRPQTRTGVEKFTKHLVGLERIAAGADQHLDLIRRQL